MRDDFIFGHFARRAVDLRIAWREIYSEVCRFGVFVHFCERQGRHCLFLVGRVIALKNKTKKGCIWYYWPFVCALTVAAECAYF